ncbi:MAG: GDP-L-fucose synthase family protein [Pyrinomonadaceae bacterium]
MDNFLDGKRICVTGGCGFLGRHVVSHLLARGHRDVIAVRRREYDLVRGTDVERLYAEVRPQVVIHLAAVVGGIQANRENPGRFFYDNLMMGAHMLEGARLAGVEKFVQLGTICAYPKWTPVPFREEDLWNGYPEETNAPYGLAKKALLVQAQAYREQYGMNAIHLLPVNLYGPGDNFDPHASHVIQALIRKFTDAVESGARRVGVWGTGEVTREFLYVEDAAEGITLAAEFYDGREPVNLGSGREISIRELARLIASEIGFDGEIAWEPNQPEGQLRRLVDTSRADAYFGFRARTELADGLRRTIQWYREVNSSAPPECVSL